MYVEARSKVIDVLVYKIFNSNDSLYYNCPDTLRLDVFVYSNHGKSKEVNRVLMKRDDSCLLATP